MDPLYGSNCLSTFTFDLSGDGVLNQSAIDARINLLLQFKLPGFMWMNHLHRRDIQALTTLFSLDMGAINLIKGNQFTRF